MATPRTEETPMIRPHKRLQTKLQRSDWRAFPSDGQGWWINPALTAPDPTAPHIDSISPTSVSVVAAAGTVTLTGINFTATSVIEIDGVAKTTVFTDATTISVSYDPLVAGNKVFRVRDGAKLSNSIDFMVTPATVADFQSKTKAEIVAWLMGEGVNIDESAVTRFTKDELLMIVEAYLTGDDVEPIINP